MVARGYRDGCRGAAATATARRHLAKQGLSADIIEGFFEDVGPRPFAIIFSNCHVSSLACGIDALQGGGI
jgi:hypothetical protein